MVAANKNIVGIIWHLISLLATTKAPGSPSTCKTTSTYRTIESTELRKRAIENWNMSLCLHGWDMISTDRIRDRAVATQQS
mmetsp:Transcript_28086/g.76204  ORF Transcript_28086/g.76204 Transcript_28086/m.76204 type:complete len:81 (-) Transcript_28086:37-279(-)